MYQFEEEVKEKKTEKTKMKEGSTNASEGSNRRSHAFEQDALDSYDQMTKQPVSFMPDQTQKEKREAEKLRKEIEEKWFAKESLFKQSLLGEKLPQSIIEDKRLSYYEDYKELTSRKDNMNPRLIQEMLEEKYKVTPQTLYNKGILIITDYKQYEKEMEDEYRLVPVHSFCDEERIDYKLCISKFQIPISVRILFQDCHIVSVGKTAQGGYGKVYKQNRGGTSYCLKKIDFKFAKQHKNNKQAIDKAKVTRSDQFEDILKEVGVCKLLGALIVSPQFHQIEQGVDVLIFNDCACFITQLCTPFDNKYWEEIQLRWQKNLSRKQQIQKQFLQRFKDDLEEILLVLFSLKIIHRDIKKDNIVYNQQLGKYQLIDFGLTHAVQGSAHQESLIRSLGGTDNYMHQYLIQMWKDKKARMFCLQYADYHSYRTAVRQIQQNIQKHCGFNTVEICQATITFEQAGSSLLIDKEINFYSLIKPLHFLFIDSWKFKIQNYEQGQKQKQLKSLKEFESEQRLRTIRSSIKSIQIVLFQQGLQSIIDFNQSANFYHLIPSDTLKLVEQMDYKIGVKYLQNQIRYLLKLRKIFVKQSQELSLAFLRKYQQELPLLIDKLVSMYICGYEKQFLIDYYKLIKDYLFEQKQVQIMYKRFQQLVEKNIGDHKHSALIIRLCDDMIFLREFNQFTFKYIEKTLLVKEKLRVYEEESTVLLLTTCALALIKRSLKQHLPHIKQYIEKADKILQALQINTKFSRVALKLQFAKVIYLSNFEQHENQALYLTLLIRQNIEKYFGASSPFYLSLIFNQAYLMRGNPTQSNTLIKEFIFKCKTTNYISYNVLQVNAKHEHLQYKNQTIYYKQNQKKFLPQATIISQEQNKNKQQLQNIFNQKFNEWYSKKQENVDELLHCNIMSTMLKFQNPTFCLIEIQSEMIENITIFLIIEVNIKYKNIRIHNLLQIIRTKLIIGFAKEGLRTIDNEEVKITKESSFFEIRVEQRKFTIIQMKRQFNFNNLCIQTFYDCIEDCLNKRIAQNKNSAIICSQFNYKNNLFDFNKIILSNINEILSKVVCKNQFDCPYNMVDQCQYIHINKFGCKKLDKNKNRHQLSKASCEILSLQNQELAGLKDLMEKCETKGQSFSLLQLFQNMKSVHNRQEYLNTNRSGVVHCRNGKECPYFLRNQCRYFHPQSRK